ncbi:MAG: oxygen-independent coproporphyrinogen III oxidase [Pseudomonadota bacterium]
MWPYHPDLLETPVPRYTSYPTAADFGSLNETALPQAIEQTRGDISLYIHIPFCEKICFYCGCNTGRANRTQRVEAYLDALHAEIATVATLLSADVRVRNVAFGGGSPNAIAPSRFLALVEHLHHHFNLADARWSIETDPRSMTSDWARAIGEAGITRASMGVQTFAKACQKAIGREQDEALIDRCVSWLRGAGVTSLNFDLMYGLPQQSYNDLADSLLRTMQLGADRIAVFGYAHVPQLVARQRAIDAETLPDRDDRFAMALQAYDTLTQAGYRSIGFDHFALSHDPMAKAARAGTLRRNFQGFTEDPSDVLIGFGSSAISGFPGLIAQNEKKNGRYQAMVMQGKLTASVGIARNHQDRIRAQLIEDLLCRDRAQLPLSLDAAAYAALTPFIERGLARIDGTQLSITSSGLPYARVIASLFDTYRAAASTRFSSAI